MTFDGDARTISGTPAIGTKQEAREYTYTATDADDDSGSTTFTITIVEDTLPTLAPVSNRSYIENSPIETLQLPAAEDGNTPYEYSLTGNLAPGLTYDPESLQITGTPTEATAPRQFAWKAKDVDGDEVDVKFNITILRDTKPSLIPIGDKNLSTG